MESLGASANKKEESSLGDYITKTSSLKWAQRIDSRSLTQELVEEVVFKKGEPLVVTNMTLSWRREKQMFSWDWLKRNYGDQTMRPTNNDTQTQVEEMTMSAFVSYIIKPAVHRGAKLYGKDIPCPEQWEEFISSKIEPYWTGAPSDLLGCLNEDLQPDTVSMTMATEETHFPLQYKTLGAIGYNIMVHADDGAASWWLITPRSEKEKLEELIKKKSNSPILVESYVLPLSQFAEVIVFFLGKILQAGFNIFAIEQKDGDLVIVPSEASYQVFNKFGKTTKVQWDTINAFSAQISYYSSLPATRAVGKPETYKVKACAYYALQELLQSADNGEFDEVPFPEAFTALLDIVEDIIFQESINMNHLGLSLEERSAFKLEVKKFNDEVQHGRTCDFCKCDIFNRCYHCAVCPEEGYDVCMSCFAEGRGCIHKEKLELFEYIPNDKLRRDFKGFIELYHKIIKSVKRKKNISKKFKALTEWKPKRPLLDSELDKESAKIDEVTDASISYRLMMMYRKENTEEACHQCQKVQPYGLSPMISCTKFVGEKRSAPKKCDKKFCSRCLWNRYGEKVVICLKSINWVCPCCRQICNCSACSETKPADGATEKIVNALAENFYPFAAMSTPNVPAISDLKPTFQVHSLKKRKMMFNSDVDIKPLEVPKLEEQGPVVVKKEEGKMEVDAKPHEKDYNVWEIKPEHASTNPTPSAPSSLMANTPWGGSWGGGNENAEVVSTTPAKPHRDVVNTVLIRNLDYGVAESALYQLFGTLNVESVVIPKKNGKKKGIAFVKFKSKELAENGMRTHNLHKFNERAIEMCWAEDRATQQQKASQKQQLVCFFCHQPGHVKFQCPTWTAQQHPKQPQPEEPHPAILVPEPVSILAAPTDVPSLIQDSEYEKSKRQATDRGFKLDARTCYKCGKEGHMTLQCPEKSIDTTQGPQLSTSSRIVCFKCGTPGHTAPQCEFRSKGCWVCGQEGHVAKECSKKKTEGYGNQNQYILDQPQDPYAAYGASGSSYSDPYHDSKSRKVGNESSPTPRDSSDWSTRSYGSGGGSSGSGGYKESRSTGWDDRGGDRYDDRSSSRDSYGSYRGSGSYRTDDRKDSSSKETYSSGSRKGSSSYYDGYSDRDYDRSRDSRSSMDYYDYKRSSGGQDYYGASASSSSRSYNDNYNGSYRSGSGGSLSSSGQYGQSKGYSPYSNGSSSTPNRSANPSQQQSTSYSPVNSMTSPPPVVAPAQIPLTALDIAYYLSLTDPRQAQAILAANSQENPLTSILSAPQNMNSSFPPSTFTQNPQTKPIQQLQVPPMQPMLSSSSSSSNPTSGENTTPNGDSQRTYSDEEYKKRQGYKSKCGDYIVRYLNKYFQPPAQLVASKEDFKLLAKKMTSSMLDKVKGKNYYFDRDEESRAKKCVDKLVDDYLKVKTTTPDQLTQWLNSSSSF